MISGEYMRKLMRKIKYPNNKGTTMFETIVAFFILTIILALIYQMIAFCAQLRMKATDTGAVLEKFNEDMYREDIKTDGSLTSETTVGSIKVIPRSSDSTGELSGPLFYLTLSSDTKDDNLGGGKKVSDYQTTSYRLRLTNLHANSLISNDSRIGDVTEGKNNIVTPKALQFYYRK